MDHSCGIFTRRELLALGYDDGAIRRACEAGDLIRLRSGWYAIRTHDPQAAVAVRAGGALSCVSALQHHGLWVPPGYSDVHVRRSKAKSSAGESCRAFGGPRPVRSAVDPVPVALACAARCMSTEDWVAVCDSWFNSTGSRAGDLRAALGDLGPRVEELLARTDWRSQSGTESICRVRLRALGFHVVVQPQIAGVGRADLRVGRLILECDSRLYHSDARAYRNDRRRDRRATVDGWLTMRLTFDDVLFGWADTLGDIRGVTAPDRHRIRSDRSRRAVQRSSALEAAEGNMPSEWL